ncbi:proline iminopeptidase [Bacillus cereus]|nr:alpha/beta fold hydrolase [Bacillus nitratireducens]PEE16198.1 proline iminopeptidase [Bacillus cereus]MED0906467.1 alpha/beta fold hydrolase [Bacillus nitratireducens]PFH91273.1 proline iminopeptidase [Bacillus cereus]PFM50121.1 proline iminopeptidase [Bacillus cereus]PGS21830.1 proline iminopeptidase [Bacillus cereus]
MTNYMLKDGERNLDISDIKHWCKVAGAAHNTVPLIIVHGGPGGNHYVFERTLGMKLEEYLTVVYYEQRGCGRSEAPQDDNDYSINTLAEDLEELRKRLNINKVNLLGYSFGGQLCLEYALKYPETVEKMVLQAPLLDDYDEVYRVQIEGFLKVTEGKMKEQISIISKLEISLKERNNQVWNIVDTEIVDRLLFKNQEFAKLNRTLWEESHLSNTGKMSKVIFETQSIVPLIERINGLEQDTCVIVGAYDYNTGVEMSKRITSHMKNSKLIIFENSAHFPDIEETDNVCEAIIEFLEI